MSPVEPSEPPRMPPIDPDTALKRFAEMLSFLADNGALSVTQVDEQVDALTEFLDNGEDGETLPHPDMNLTMDQAELVYIARDFSMWYAADEFEVEDLQQELLYVAMSLGIIEGAEPGGTVVLLPAPGTPPVDEPRPAPPEYQPTPAELEMMELLRELAVQIEQGELTPDEAWQRLAAIAGDQGWDIPFDGPDAGAPELVSDAEAVDSSVLLALRSKLASRVQDDALSSADAWNELTQALDSPEQAADSGGTAVRATTWGAVKASMR